jgi:hypothetical protein
MEDFLENRRTKFSFFSGDVSFVYVDESGVIGGLESLLDLDESLLIKSSLVGDLDFGGTGIWFFVAFSVWPDCGGVGNCFGCNAGLSGNFRNLAVLKT